MSRLDLDTPAMRPEFDTVRFTQIWDNASDFISDYTNQSTDFANGIPQKITVENATTLFYLLYARYGNNPISNFDITQWKYKLFSIIFQYGPAWEKRLEIQARLKQLTETDPEFRKGSKAIYNQALNPATEPSTATLTELTYINQQNTTNYNKSLMDAYAQLWDLLDTDVSEEFLKKFQKLFKQFVMPEHTYIYISEVDEDDGN